MLLYAAPPMSGIPHPRDRDTVRWTKLYSPALRRYFGRRAQPGEVDDLVQEVLLRVQATKATSEVENAEGYLFRVAHNVLVSRRRSEQSRGGRAFEQFGQAHEVADDFSPERILIARDEYARACKAILGLPPRARAAFQFHRFENMTYGEIAEVMGISKESVKELMHRAIAKLAEAMAETDDDHV